MYDVNHHISGSTPDGKGIPPTAKIVPGLGTPGSSSHWGDGEEWFGGPAIFCWELVARTQ
jgi:hypothetical protein